MQMNLRMESLAFSYIFVREHVSAISHAISHVPIRFLDSTICTNHKAGLVPLLHIYIQFPQAAVKWYT